MSLSRNYKEITLIIGEVKVMENSENHITGWEDYHRKCSTNS